MTITIRCSKCKMIEDEFNHNEKPEDFGYTKKGKKWYCPPCSTTIKILNNG